MGRATLNEKASRILQLLDLEFLRARYHSYRPQMVEFARLSGRSLLLLEVIEVASSRGEREKQLREARVLRWLPRIVARRIELAADGISLRVASYPERGGDELTVSVELNSRGERILSGNGPALSSALGNVRRFLWIVYFAVAFALLGAVYSERIWRLGGQQLIGVIAVAVFALLTWRYRRRS